MSSITTAQNLRAQNPMLESDGAAAYIGIKTGTLNNWAMTGKGPKFYKIGRCRRYLQSDLDDYIQSRVYGGSQ